MTKTNLSIFVDTMLYNPTTYIYNVSNDKALVYNLVDDVIYSGTVQDNRVLVIPPHDRRLRWYYHLDYMFDLSEVRSSSLPFWDRLGICDTL